MTFSSKAARRWQHVVASAMALAAVALIGACGGSTTQYEPFIAQRVFAFGDETSTLRTDGKRYAVNGLDNNNTFDCSLNPIWVQSVAGYYGYVYAECNTATLGVTPRAFMFAAAGAKVADVAAQVDAQVASGGMRDKDLALITAGTNDMLELYAQYPALTEESLILEARARGDLMAAVVNRLVDLGAKVVVANLPDLGLTPFARAEALANAGLGSDRAGLMSRLSSAFNERLGVKVLLDGRFVGLVQMDQRSLAIGRSPVSFGLTDVSTAVCTVALPDCTTATVVTDATPATYLWADSTRLGSGGQATLAALALERVQRNPF